MNNCPVCNRSMFLRGSYGHWGWYCPARFDGLHPEIKTWVSDGTGTKPDSNAGEGR